MIDPQSLQTLGDELRRCMESDRAILDEHRSDTVWGRRDHEAAPAPLSFQAAPSGAVLQRRGAR